MKATMSCMTKNNDFTWYYILQPTLMDFNNAYYQSVIYSKLDILMVMMMPIRPIMDVVSIQKEHKICTSLYFVIIVHVPFKIPYIVRQNLLMQMPNYVILTLINYC